MPEEAQSYKPGQSVLYFQICRAFRDHDRQEFGFIEGAEQSKIMVPGEIVTIGDASYQFDKQGKYGATMMLREEPESFAVGFYGGRPSRGEEDRRVAHIIRHQFKDLVSVDPDKAINLETLLDEQLDGIIMPDLNGIRVLAA